MLSEFLFDKKNYYERVRDWVFVLYFEMLWKTFSFCILVFSLKFYRFSKIGYELKDRLLDCMAVYSHSLFLLTTLSIAFETVCGVIFDPYVFFRFLENCHLKPDFLLSMNTIVLKSSLYERLSSNFCSAKKLWPLD